MGYGDTVDTCGIRDRNDVCIHFCALRRERPLYAIKPLSSQSRHRELNRSAIRCRYLTRNHDLIAEIGIGRRVKRPVEPLDENRLNFCHHRDMLCGYYHRR